MSKKYAVAINGDPVVWKDGKFTSDNKDLEKWIHHCEIVEAKKPFTDIWLDGSILYSGKRLRPSKYWELSYGFLQTITGGDMEFIAGDKPTWESLGYKTEDGAVY